MSNKDTHELDIYAFGPSRCRFCHRSGAELVAFGCKEPAVADPSLNPQVDNHLNNEVDGLIWMYVTNQHTYKIQFGDKELLPCTFCDAKQAILNIINQEKAKLLKRVDKEVVGEDEVLPEVKGTLESGRMINGNASRKRNQLRKQQRTQLNRIKQEEGLK